MRLGRTIMAVVGLAAGLMVSAKCDAADAQTVSLSAPIAKQDPAQPPATYTIQTRVPLTILDVVVTDSKGKPVRDLKQSDFAVLEDGRRVAPKTFEEHRSDQMAPKAAEPPKLNLGPNTFTNLMSVPSKAGPLNILLEDDLNTPFTGQSYIRNQMIEFLRKSPPGTPMAIFRLSSQLSILQGFTADAELLKNAITGKNNLPQESNLFTTGMDAEAHLEWSGTNVTEVGSNTGPGDAPSRFAASALKIARGMSGTGDDADDSASGTMSPAQRARLFTDTTRGRVQLTLAAMTQIARYLSGMPGRKNLVWFSGSFPVNIRPNLSVGEDYSDSVKSIGDILARSQAAVYSIDGRGLDGNPYQAGFTCPIKPNDKLPLPCSLGVPAPTLDSKARTINEHGTMEMVSNATGGKAFYNTNDLVGAVEEALDDGSNYYTITYTPTNDKQDSKYRKIHVELDHPGLHLAYRPGYSMDAPGGPKREQKAGAGAGTGSGATRPNAMQIAMVRGSVEPTEILFKAKVVASVATEDTLPSGNKPVAAMLKPPYRRYTVYYLAGINNIAFVTTPDGSRRGDIEFAAVVYNADGETVNAQTSPVRANIPAADFQNMLKNGMQVNLNIDAPVRGEYYLRLGIHDFTSDHIGAVEIPLSKVRPEAEPVVTPNN